MPRDTHGAVVVSAGCVRVCCLLTSSYVCTRGKYLLLVGNELGCDQSTPGLLVEERSEGSVAWKGRLMLYFTG